MQTIIPAPQEILSRIGVEHRPEDAIKVAVQRYRRLAHSNSMMDDFSLLLQKIVSIISRVAALTLDRKVWNDGTEHIPRRTPPRCTHYVNSPWNGLL